MFLLEVSLCSQCDTICRSSLMYHCFDRLSELRCWLSQSVDNLELRVYKRVPKPTSQGCSCLALSRECPSILLCRKYVFLWLLQCCFKDWYFEVPVHPLNWLVCQPRLAELSRTVSCWPCLKVLPDPRNFCVICIFTESNVSFALSTTASVVSLFAISWRFPLLLTHG